MDLKSNGRRLPPLWLAAVVSIAVLLFYVFLRFYLYSHTLVPLTYALPLLLSIWHQSRRLHYAQLVTYCVLSIINVVAVENEQTLDLPKTQAIVMMLVNILTVGFVIDRLLVSQQRLINLNEKLQETNLELEASNEELAAREEEISRQNEELQGQAEELEQQAEELQQQTEELQQQTEELQLAHQESANRERVLQSLLEVTTGLQVDQGLSYATNNICIAAVSAFGDGVEGSQLVERTPAGLEVLGRCGVCGSAAPSEQVDSPEVLPTLDPLLDLVIDQGRAACIEDLEPAHRSRAPHAADGSAYRAVLAAPLDLPDGTKGALAVYSRRPRLWSESEFHVINWFGAQASLVLKAVHLQEELDARSREAEEASRQKTRFLAAVSHDVRTPANAIVLSAELIKQIAGSPSMADEIPEVAERLRANAKLLVELVSDVLDLSRFDYGRVDVTNSVFDLAEVIRNEVARYASLAEAGGISLQAEIQEKTPLRISCDRLKLARVLGNLIGNAIKFTEVGSVKIQCRGAINEPLEIIVTDTGVGIQPEHLTHIFDEFYQIQNPERDRSKGTGLGLAISKRLVDALHGTLTVESTPGIGSRFVLRLPPEVRAPLTLFPAGQQASADGQSKPLDGVRLLIVEDHLDTRTVISKLLRMKGATVDTAADGRSGMQSLSQGQFDVLLLDLMLPDMDGREILRHLNENERPDPLRCVLALSGDVTAARLAEINALGADGLVPKPVTVERLVDEITSRLSSQASV